MIAHEKGPGLGAPHYRRNPDPQRMLAKKAGAPAIARTPAARSTVPPHTNCSIKTTSSIIKSTAMTRLMGLFILTSPLVLDGMSVA